MENTGPGNKYWLLEKWTKATLGCPESSLHAIMQTYPWDLNSIDTQVRTPCISDAGLTNWNNGG